MKSVRHILAVAYALFIIYYTILNRTPGAEQIFKPLFWEISRGAWRDISLNILLFVPLGLLIGSWKGVVLGFILSLIIELTQLVFCLGFCELDDIINNTIGTAIGVGTYMGFCKLLNIYKQ